MKKTNDLQEAFERDFLLSDLNKNEHGEYCHKDTRRLYRIYSKGFKAAAEYMRNQAIEVVGSEDMRDSVEITIKKALSKKLGNNYSAAKAAQAEIVKKFKGM